MMHRYSVGATAVLAYCKLAGYGALALFGKFSLEAAIAVDTLGYGVAWIILRRAYRRNCIPAEGAPAFRPEPAERKRLLRYGLYNNFNDAGTLLLSSRSDNFFIAAFIDPISVGIYSFYTRLNEMIGNVLPVRLFENVINPLFFSMPRQDAVTRIPAYFSLLLNLNMLLQWPIFAFTVAHHEQIVRVVFGGKFVEHSWLMPLVVGFGVLATISIPVTMVAQYYEKARVIMLSKVFAGVNVVLLLVLVPMYGVYGAAFATGLSTFCKNLFIWSFVRDRAVWTNAVPVLVSGLLIWGTAAGISEALAIWLPVPDLLHLLIGAVVFALAGLVWLRSPVLSISDRAILASVMRGREAGLLRRLGMLGRAP
jgi:O-antigen/teichoic acid export membrane protein